MRNLSLYGVIGMHLEIPIEREGRQPRYNYGASSRENAPLIRQLANNEGKNETSRKRGAFFVYLTLLNAKRLTLDARLSHYENIHIRISL